MLLQFLLDSKLGQDPAVRKRASAYKGLISRRSKQAFQRHDQLRHWERSWSQKREACCSLLISGSYVEGLGRF
jgi:hypothetical protein